jgi:hypothetical protein
LREKTVMSSFIERLYTSDEPAVRYKTRVDLFDENPATPEARELQDAIKTSARVRSLLAKRDEHGRLPSHPYSKWHGAHWVLVALADLDYPPGDETLLPLREQVYEWLFSDSRLRSIKQYTVAGRVRMCASMEANALFALLKLDLADERIDRLAQRLLAWQWPDGGWNCDKKRQTQVSSFTETLLPLRALSLYSRSTGHQEASVASERAAEYFLQHRLFKRKSDGSVISGDFLKLFYPYYWHYNILFGLKVLAEAGQIDDPRCREALAILDAKCLPDGGYPAEKKYYRVAEQLSNGCSAVDWGGTSTKQMNPFVTVEALSVLKRATLSQSSPSS